MKTISLFLALLLPLLLSAQPGSAQSEMEIEGRVLDQKTGEPIAYANIYNKSINRGAISDLEGYFKIRAQKYTDSIFVSFIGYQSAQIPLSARTNYYEVFLLESAQTLGEITVRPSDDTYLFDLMNACKAQRAKTSVRAKVAYDLKSYVGKQQVELMECFYNGQFNGYDIETLELKTGRMALQPYGERIFISTESSRAISMLKLLDKNEYFPVSPLSLNKKNLKKSYYLELHQKYKDEKLDSIFVLDFTPKDSSGAFFKGRVWINYSKKNLVKVRLQCIGAVKHPFLPLFPNDNIEQVDLNITRSFEEIGGKAYFKHVDFSYHVTYKSRDQQDPYRVSTSAVLYAYNFGERFFIPAFHYVEGNIGDYRKISAIPYNAPFWKNNLELKLSDKENKNELFFNSPRVITNKTLFSKNYFSKKGLFEHPYLAWSPNRISFQGQFAGNDEKDPNAAVVAKPYELAVKLYLDINTIADTLQVSTATIFDPFESHYRLPVNDTVLCFVNMYFDLMEIHRRELETLIGHSPQSIAAIESLYQKQLEKIEIHSARFFKEVKQGKKKNAMENWNEYIFKELGIDNISFFKIFSKSKK